MLSLYPSFHINYPVCYFLPLHKLVSPWILFHWWLILSIDFVSSNISTPQLIVCQSKFILKLHQVLQLVHGCLPAANPLSAFSLPTLALTAPQPPLAISFLAVAWTAILSDAVTSVIPIATSLQTNILMVIVDHRNKDFILVIDM